MQMESLLRNKGPLRKARCTEMGRFARGEVHRDREVYEDAW